MIDLSPPVIHTRRVTLDSNGYITGFGLTEVPKEKVMLQKGQFVIGSIQANGESISLAARPRPHLTQSAANLEAERLARLEPGKQFVVLEIKGMVTAQTVVWH